MQINLINDVKIYNQVTLHNQTGLRLAFQIKLIIVAQIYNQVMLQFFQRIGKKETMKLY